MAKELAKLELDGLIPELHPAYLPIWVKAWARERIRHRGSVAKNPSKDS